MKKTLFFAFAAIAAMLCLTCGDNAASPDNNGTVAAFAGKFNRKPAGNGGGQDDKFTLAVYTGAGGSVSVSPKKDAYSRGDTVTVTAAVTADGYVFTGWSGAAAGTENPVKIVMTSNKELTAGFGKPGAERFTVRFNGNYSGATAPAAISADAGDSITLPGITRTYYDFGGWYKDAAGTGTKYDAGKSYAVTRNDTLYAKWTIITYTVSVGRNLTDGGSVSVNNSNNPAGAVPYNAGTSMTLKATANANYKFVKWAAAGTSLPAGVKETDATITFTLNGRVDITANFTQNSTGGDNSYTDTTFTDGRNGHKYKIVKIGAQIWFAENMNYDTADGTNSWCYGSADSASNCVKYGRLYNWNRAMTVCPSGWHLPTRAEWNTLVSAGSAGPSGSASMALKSKTGWGNDGNGKDELGFAAKPGGRRNTNGSFNNIGSIGYWWTGTGTASGTTVTNSSAYYRYIDNYSVDVVENSDVIGQGFSVRCLKD
jgi:uncharacterized protein (TIGR02145 family)/uncharacterized repeat protein (TIGR02543 family)